MFASNTLTSFSFFRFEGSIVIIAVMLVCYGLVGLLELRLLALVGVAFIKAECFALTFCGLVDSPHTTALATSFGAAVVSHFLIPFFWLVKIFFL